MSTAAATPEPGRSPAAAARPARGPDADVGVGWRTTRSTDGTEIAWRVDGSRPRSDRGPGPPAPPGSDRGPGPPGPVVVCCNGIACSDHYWADVVPPLAAHRPVVRWDYRGHGRSAAPADRDRIGVDAVVDDLVAVLDAADVARAVLVGHSYGVQVALEGARRLAPERVAGVVAVAGSPGAPLSRLGVDPGTVLFPLAEVATSAAPRTTARVWRRLWGSPAAYWVARAVRGTTADAPRPVLDGYFAHVGRLDLELLVRMFAAMEAHSAADVLAHLPVPLLAVAGDADGLTPVSVLRAAALAAPDGELVVVHGASHTLPAEHPARLAAEIEMFLARLPEPPR